MTFQRLEQAIVPHRPLNAYKLMSFDIFGTLVDEEGGVSQHILPLQQYLPASHPLKTDQKGFYCTWHAVELELRNNNPKMRYNQILSNSMETMARRELGISDSTLDDGDLHTKAEAFGDSVKEWPAFPDTIPALYQLKELGWKLVPLTNMSNSSWADSNRISLQGFPFDAVYTGEDIGSYKPDHRNFVYLFEHVKDSFGIEKSDILHTAHGLNADHAPAKALSLQSVWIERLGSASETPQEAEEGLKDGKWTFGWRAGTLQDLVHEIKKQAAG